MRKARVGAGVSTVFLTTNRLSDEPQYHTAVTVTPQGAADDTAGLLAYALSGMEHIFQAGFRSKKAGVLLAALVPASPSSAPCLL